MSTIAPERAPQGLVWSFAALMSVAIHLAAAALLVSVARVGAEIPVETQISITSLDAPASVASPAARTLAAASADQSRELARPEPMTADRLAPSQADVATADTAEPVRMEPARDSAPADPREPAAAMPEAAPELLPEPAEPTTERAAEAEPELSTARTEPERVEAAEPDRLDVSDAAPVEQARPVGPDAVQAAEPDQINAAEPDRLDIAPTGPVAMAEPAKPDAMTPARPETNGMGPAQSVAKAQTAVRADNPREAPRPAPAERSTAATSSTAAGPTTAAPVADRAQAAVRTAAAAPVAAPKPARPALPRGTAPQGTAPAIAAPVPARSASDAIVAGPPPARPVPRTADYRSVRVARFLKAYDGGSCFLAVPLENDDGVVRFRSFAGGRNELRRFGQAAREAVDVEAVSSRDPVNEAQCLALSFARNLPRYPDFTLRIELDQEEISNGGALAGSILNAGAAALHLLLVDDEGMVQSLNRPSGMGEFGGEVGARRFSMPMTLQGDPLTPTQLVIAIASDRPIAALDGFRRAPAAELFDKLREEAATTEADLDFAVAAFSVRQ